MLRRFAVLSTLALAACQTTGPSMPSPNLPPPPPASPRGAIFGHAAFHLKSGVHGACTGLSIALMRDTPAFRDRLVKLYGSSEHAGLPTTTVKARSAKLGPAPDSPLVATAQCDSRGFQFPGLTGGSYYIIGRVRIGSPGRADEDYVVLRHIGLGDGEAREVSLAP